MDILVLTHGHKCSQELILGYICERVIVREHVYGRVLKLGYICDHVSIQGHIIIRVARFELEVNGKFSMQRGNVQNEENSLGFLVYDWDRTTADDLCGLAELPVPLSKVRIKLSPCLLKISFYACLEILLVPA